MKQKTIGFITAGFDGFYFGQLLWSIHNITREYGYRLILVRNDNRYVFQIPLAANNIDGWLTASHSVTKEYIDKLLEYKKPVVNISHFFEGCHSVHVDNVHGMFEAVEHLILHGHRDIAYVNLDDDYDCEQRLLGYKKAVEKYGIPYNPQLVITIKKFSPSGGHDAGKELLSNGIPFTAIAVCADFLVPSLYEYMKQSGLRIPEDIAVAGFDNSLESEVYNPPLTTVEQKIGELAVQAFKLLIKHIENPGQPPEKIYMNTSLICRSSCGCNYYDKNQVSKANQLISRQRNLMNEANDITKLLCWHVLKYNVTQSLTWLSPTPVKRALLALFTEDVPNLLKAQLFYPDGEEKGFCEEAVTAADFPHEDVISSYTRDNNVMLIVAVQSDTSPIGALCCSAPLSAMNFIGRAIPFLKWIAFSFEKENLARQLDILAHHDPLCGLPNRKLLLETMSNFIEAAKSQPHRFAVMLMDLDNFKKVNDALGHDAGDELLIQVAGHLRDIVGDNDMVARLGGDEFVILISNAESRSQITEIARKIIDTINIPFSTEGLSFNVTASLGISFFPEHGNTPSALLKSSDIAMYQVKEKGKNTFCYFNQNI